MHMFQISRLFCGFPTMPCFVRFRATCLWGIEEPYEATTSWQIKESRFEAGTMRGMAWTLAGQMTGGAHSRG